MAHVSRRFRIVGERRELNHRGGGWKPPLRGLRRLDFQDRLAGPVALEAA
jgi:hypothetical protein